MAHKPLIDGTAYEISGGKVLVNGTAYSIKNGKTLIGGTAYTIPVKKKNVTLTITGNGCDPYPLAYYKINGTTYYPDGNQYTHTLSEGDQITFVCVMNNTYGYITVDNGSGLPFQILFSGLTSECVEKEWTYTMTRNATVEFSSYTLLDDMLINVIAEYGTIAIKEYD